MNMATVGALLLLVGGAVNAVPPINAGLAGLFGGTPVFQILIGAASVLIGLVMLAKKAAIA